MAQDSPYGRSKAPDPDAMLQSGSGTRSVPLRGPFTRMQSGTSLKDRIEAAQSDLSSPSAYLRADSLNSLKGEGTAALIDNIRSLHAGLERSLAAKLAGLDPFLAQQSQLQRDLSGRLDRIHDSLTRLEARATGGLSLGAIPAFIDPNREECGSPQFPSAVAVSQQPSVASCPSAMPGWASVASNNSKASTWRVPSSPPPPQAPRAPDSAGFPDVEKAGTGRLPAAYSKSSGKLQPSRSASAPSVGFLSTGTSFGHFGQERTLFRLLDSNNDGVLDEEELQTGLESGNIFSNRAEDDVKPAPTNKLFSARGSWHEQLERDADALLSIERVDDRVTFHGTITEMRRTAQSCSLMVPPSSRLRLCWDLLGILFIFYDLLSIPVELAFTPSETDFTTYSMRIIMFFWTADIPLTFVTGYYDEGKECMLLRKIAWRYMRTWLALDIVIVSIDWVMLFFSEKRSGVAMLRGARILRILRTLRLLRLAKMRKIMEHIVDNIASEYTHVCINMLKQMVLVLAINHIVACTWYGIGTIEPARGRAWIEDGHFETVSSTLYRYLTSMHWSLTQFTPASMEVFPTNSYERGFAVMVLCFALLVFSSFLSSITASMTQLRQMSSLFDKDISLLRRYLRAKEVPHELHDRILRYVRYQISHRKSELQESDVRLLEVLSNPLQRELVSHTYGPVTKHLPFFRFYSVLSPGAMRNLCFSATKCHPLSLGDLVFSEGSIDDHMIFLMRGRLQYMTWPMDHTRRLSREQKSEEEEAQTKRKALESEESLTHVTEELTGGIWCCEATLWTRWVHVGTMHALTDAEILVLEAKAFQEVTKEDHRVVGAACRYCKLFVAATNQAMQRGEPLSDLARTPGSQDDPEYLAHKAFAYYGLPNTAAKTSDVMDSVPNPIKGLRNLGSSLLDLLNSKGSTQGSQASQ